MKSYFYIKNITIYSHAKVINKFELLEIITNFAKHYQKNKS